MNPALAGTILAAAPIVSGVRIDAPAAEQKTLAAYVEVQAGAPLDREALRHTLELIHATGAYADVRAELAAGADGGTEVVIRPIPGPLLTEIRVADPSPVGAKAVRTVSRLRVREPLWPARLDEAAKAVALHLAENGYPEALVTAEAGQEGRGAASALFRVRAGPRARVRRVQLAGDAAPAGIFIPEPRAGDIWRRRVAREFAEDLRRRLAREGFWRAAVRLEDTYDPADAGVDVVYHVDRGPGMRLEVRGATLPGALRETVENLLRDNGARSDAVDEAADRIEESLRSVGHREARVTARDVVDPQETRIVFDVAAGPATTALSVRVAGDAETPAAPLLTRAGEPVRDRDLDEDLRTLGRALQEQGHADARVDVEVPDRTGDVPVVFVLRAGPRSEIAAVDVRSPVALGTPSHELACRPGRPYRARDVLTDRNTVLAAYRNAGYLQADVTSRLQFDRGRTAVSVVFEVAPGPRTYVDHIVVAGLTHTREELVRRELRLKEGDPLGLEAVLESQRALGSLGVFGNVTITEIDPESPEQRSLLVRVDELPRTSLAYGIGYSERDGPRLSAEVTRRNLGGRNRSLTTFVRGSFNSLRLFTTYRQPYLFGRKQEFFVTGFREEEERDAFDYTRFGLIFETARRLSPAWSILARYATQETQSRNITVTLAEIDKQYLTATFSGPAVSLVHDTRDDPLDPRAGAFVTADTQLSHRVLGGDSFVKGFLQASLYRRIAPRLVLATNGRLGLARTLEGAAPDRLPLPDRFYAGGDYSLRGFRQDRAGPLEPSAVPGDEPFPTGGNALVLAGAELRLGVNRYFGLAAFSEAGQVYPLVDDMDVDHLRYTAGVGVRYKSVFGPIRADWGYKLNRRAGESSSRFHLTIGHAF